MAVATLDIDISKLADNARWIAEIAAAHGVGLFGVTKAVAGMPQVAQAMLDGGFVGLGESRLENVRRLRRAGITAPVMMLRIPPVSLADDVVRLTEVSLNSELTTIRALSAAAVRTDRIHDVILMAELGDLREGLSPPDLLAASDVVMELPGVRLIGVGTNLLCASGVIPSPDNMQQLSDLAEAVEQRQGIQLTHISGGNSSCLAMLSRGELPPRINRLRVGYSVLLGRNGIDGVALPGLHLDAFTVHGELIELKRKPTMPTGEVGRDAFGNMPQFDDRGERVRGIVSLGRLDLDPGSLFPTTPGVEIVTASSDHLILDVDDAQPLRVGDRLGFLLEYPSLVQAIMSPYVVKRFGQATPASPAGVHLFAAAGPLAAIGGTQLGRELSDLGFEVKQTACEADSDIESGFTAAMQQNFVPVLVTATRRTALPALRGSTGDGPLGLIWLDARAGCDPISEVADGSVLRQALEPTSGDPVAGAENTVLIGLRRVGVEAARFIRMHDLRAFTIEDVDELGVREVSRRALAATTQGTRGCALIMHVSVADSGFSDSAMRAGLSYREASQALEMIAASGTLRAVVLTGVPESATSDQLDEYLEYLLSLLGRRVMGGFAAESDAMLR